MNQICVEQNSDLQLNRLAAQRALYSRAKTVFVVHAFLSTVLAAMLSYLALRFPEVKTCAVLWGTVLSILDVCWLTPWQKKLRETAALIQESFDCDVLGLTWQPLVGKAVDYETVIDNANRYRGKEPTLASLRDWYPAGVCNMPLFLARVVCQRTNAWWDGKQRRLYAGFVLGAVVALLAGLLVYGFARNTAVPDLLLTTVVPLASGITFAVRQYRENADAAVRLEQLKDHADTLWKRALDGATEEQLTADCRTMQDELFNSRKRNVPVFDQLYWWLRSGHELQMQQNADQLAHKLSAARGDSAG